MSALSRGSSTGARWKTAPTLAYLDRWKNKYAAWKDRFSQRKSYRFFKCPGCGTYIRVPKGKGKIHIKCRCGYTLYRKT